MRKIEKSNIELDYYKTLLEHLNDMIEWTTYNMYEEKNSKNNMRTFYHGMLRGLQDVQCFLISLRVTEDEVKDKENKK